MKLFLQQLKGRRSIETHLNTKANESRWLIGYTLDHKILISLIDTKRVIIDYCRTNTVVDYWIEMQMTQIMDSLFCFEIKRLIQING